MKKNSKLGYAVLGVVFVLFNVIAFAIPTAKTRSFWVAYAFFVVAFVSQIGIWKVAFAKEDTLKSKFLGFPVVCIGVVYLILQIVAFAVFVAAPTLPVWSAIVVCVLIFGISVICMIGTEVGREEINRVEKKVEKKVFYIKLLQVDIEMLASVETNTDIKTALIKLAEKIRFSDPMSNESLVDIEVEIAAKVKELKTTDNKAKIIKVIDSLLTERNKKVKSLK